MGLLLTVIEFVLLALSVLLLWPMLGIPMH
jgi:hypothetical protein